MSYDAGIDLVVVNYRTAGDLSRFLSSYEEHRPSVPHTLHVFNVDPLPGDQAVAERGRRLGLRHYVRGDNCGYAKAVNAVAALSGREMLVALNADVRLTAGAVDDCFETLMGRDDCGVLGPRQLNSDGQITHAGIFGTNVDPRLRGWKQPDRSEFYDVRDDAVSVSGSAYFVKRHVWDELATCPTFHGFDPRSKGAMLETDHYYEETFVSYHARAHGWKVLYLGPVFLYHEWHRASPVGGATETVTLPESQEMFRAACAAHGIACN